MARRYDRLREILRLDPITQHCEIYRLSMGFEFPWDYRRALEIALFRTFCVPSVSGLLAATREFTERPQKRYDDTAILIAELAEHGYDSVRGRQALRTMNRLHGRYAISNDDLRYVLSTFVFEPVRFIRRFGWRTLSGHECQAGFHFYRAIGRRMGIRDLPADYAEFERFNRDYEHTHFRYRESNRLIGEATLNLFCGWYPTPARPFARRGVLALLDRPMLDAFGFPEQPAALRELAAQALLLRAAVVRQLPPRRVSRLAGDPGNRTYPGYPVGCPLVEVGAGPPPADLDPRWLRAARGGVGDDDDQRGH